MGYSVQYFRHTLVAIAATILNGLLYYGLRIVLFQHLSVEQYGLFYSAMSFSLVLHPILSMGFDPGIVPHVTRRREQGDWGGMKSLVIGGLAPQLILAGILLACIWPSAQSIAQLLFGAENAASTDAAWVLRLIVLHALLILPFKTGLGLLLGLQYVGWRNIAESARAAMILIAVALLLWTGAGIRGVAIAYLIGTVGSIGIEIIAVARSCPALLRAKSTWHPALVAEVFRSGKYASIAFGGVLVFSQMDTMMLTLLGRNLRDVAAYQLAIPSWMVLQGLMVAVAMNFLPMAATLWHRGEEELLADGLGRLFEAAAVLFVPAATLLACFSDIFMAIVFRRDVLNAPAAFNILAVGGIFFFTSYLSMHVLVGIERPRDAAGAILFGIAISILLNLALIPFLGTIGAALSTVFGYLAATAFAVIRIRRCLPLRMRRAVVMAVFLAAVALIAAGVVVRHTSFMHEHPVATAFAAAGLLYAACIGCLGSLGFGRFADLAKAVLGK